MATSSPIHKPDILAALAQPGGRCGVTVDAEAQDLHEHFEERAAILEYDAGLPRPEAELEAARITSTLARNRGYAWASLRAAFADYPAVLCQVPDRPGPVDALLFGMARLAVLKGRRVARQGGFTGSHEVVP